MDNTKSSFIINLKGEEKLLIPEEDLIIKALD
jgi:hypothetical protein